MVCRCSGLIVLTMAVSRSGRCRPIPADRRAGYLVEKLSGMGFGEFLRTGLFEPLGMRDTAFWVPSDKTERFASCYQPETGAAV